MQSKFIRRWILDFWNFTERTRAATKEEKKAAVTTNWRCRVTKRVVA